MPKSNIGRVLEKLQDGKDVSTSTESGSTIRQRRFEYEDGVIARSVEAREQIRRMAQPFVFTREEMDAQRLLFEEDENESVHSLLQDLRNRVTLKKPGLGATVLITSIGKSSQSTLLARNLAAVIAADESRTSLLMELWDSGASLYGSEPAEYSLPDFIEKDEIQVDEILLPTGLRRMRVIPFFGANYTSYEYLRSTRLRILIKDVTRRFPRDRFTIIDAPPIDKVSDVELLNEYADQIVVCLPYGEVTQAQLKKGLAKLDREKLLGTVLSGAPKMKGFWGNLAK